jgi:hypothetical protein
MERRNVEALADNMRDLINPIQRAAALLGHCGEDASIMPPTELYNEGWLLRLVLDWYSRNPNTGKRITFTPEAVWYSEALLPSRFLGIAKREGYTHADAVIGQVAIRKPRGDARLLAGATQFIVIEAKMGSPLSKGVKNATTFNQAARNVACMLQMLTDTGQERTVANLAFLVFAPSQRIDEGYFSAPLERSGIKQAILDRDEETANHKEWCERHLDLVVDRMRIEAVAWEELLGEITEQEAGYGAQLFAFYQRCCKYNGLQLPVVA